MLFDFIPGLAAIEKSNCTEEFCFICGRATDHFGEHSPWQLLRIFDVFQKEEAEMKRECVREFGYHTDHTDCDRILADMNSSFSPWQDGPHNWNWT